MKNKQKLTNIYKDLTGKKFSRLKVIKRVANKNGKVMSLCHCDCGNKVIVANTMLKSGNTKSCGCLNRELSRERLLSHGMSQTRIYRTWAPMMDRCRNKNNKYYEHYGGRGIKVCKEWLGFENFYKDMGDKPKGLSLDRIDNDGDYCKENCRWATRKQQANNTSKNVPVTINGLKSDLGELAKIFNLKRSTLWNRLYKNGWNLEKSLKEPVKITKNYIGGNNE